MGCRRNVVGAAAGLAERELKPRPRRQRGCIQVHRESSALNGLQGALSRQRASSLSHARNRTLLSLDDPQKLAQFVLGLGGSCFVSFTIPPAPHMSARSQMELVRRLIRKSSKACCWGNRDAALTLPAHAESEKVARIGFLRAATPA